MITWLSENLGTIVISLVLLAIVAGIILSIWRDKKKGKSSCGCNCGHCAMSGTCHQAAGSKKTASNRK
ncbi:MAG: FeoB-associated Cys-rich membrane protein [Clostridiales bacterium]|nr:FeoB-associated Cys-rich membrane protein [Clostridiales bacterium]